MQRESGAGNLPTPHENSGTWFWWGTGNSTPEEYIDLWKRTRRIFDEKGVNNVVWAYSPDKDLTPEQYFSTYPAMSM